MTPVEVSLWAQAIASASGSAVGLGRVAGLGLDHDRVGEEGRRGGRLGELLRELAVGEVQGALAHQPGGGGLPEGGRAAVAERDLVAVGKARRARRGPPRTRPTRSLTGAWRCEVPISVGAAPPAAASASGRTFEGPQPKRPSAGFSSAGIWAVVEVAIGGDRLLTGAGGLPPGPRLGWPHSPGRVQEEERMYPVAYEADFNPTPNRLTTFFRLILAIPWLIVAVVYLIAVIFTHLFAWVAVIVLGRYPEGSTTSTRASSATSCGSAPGSTCRLTPGRRSASPSDPTYPIRVRIAPAGRAPEPAEGALPLDPGPADASVVTYAVDCVHIWAWPWSPG